MKKTLSLFSFLMVLMFSVQSQKDVMIGSMPDPDVDQNFYEGMNKTDVTIGTGTDIAQRYPIYSYFGYSYSQNIYLQSEVGSAGTITNIRYYFNGTSLTNSNQWEIYIGHTTKNMFMSENDWVPVDSMVLVYSDTFASPTAAGWIDFDITDFDYDGVRNIVIACDESKPNYNTTNDRFYCSAVPEGRGIVYYSDVTDNDPAAPQSAGYYGQMYVANIVMTINPVVYPGITTQPVGDTICENNSYSMTVASDFSTSHQWYKDGTALMDGGHISGATTDSLSISSASSADNGSYFCEVNYNGVLENSDTVDVFVDPCSGINDQEAGLVQMYPNPGSGVFYFNIPQGSKELVIFNAAGEQICSYLVEGLQVFQADLTGQHRGVYVARISGTNASISTSFVIE